MPVTIVHALYPQRPAESILKESNARSGFIEQMSNASVVIPTIRVGSHILRDKLYTFDGQVLTATPENLAAVGGAAIVNGNALANGIVSAFGGLSSPASPSAQTVVTAEFLEIDITVPGRPIDRHRRTIFDLLDQTARANPQAVASPSISESSRRYYGLALSGSISVLTFGASLNEDWIGRSANNGIAAAASSSVPVRANSRTNRRISEKSRSISRLIATTPTRCV